MTSGAGIDGEELENVPLVKMEDVQPNGSENFVNVETLEDIVVDDDENESECVVEGDNSNIESMVSIKSEDTVYEDDQEFIVPEILNDNLADRFKSPQLSTNVCAAKSSKYDSWPTLEILPGGVIQAAKFEDYSNDMESNELMYACAKCEQSFKYLIRLSEHVRLHEHAKRGAVKKRRTRRKKGEKTVHIVC